MPKHGTLRLLSLIVVLTLFLSACAVPPSTAPSATAPAAAESPAAESPAEETPMVEEEAGVAEEIGTEAHPIKVLFVPSVDAQVIVSGGEIMAQALNEATGLHLSSLPMALL